MYRTVCLLIMLSISAPVFAARTVVTQTPVYNRYYSPQAYYGGDYVPNYKYQRRNSSVFSDINDLERYALNRNFTRDSDLMRIERLETLAFGAVQQGDIYTRYDNLRNAILSRPKQNYKTSLFQGINNYFNGQLTGFTPSLNNNFDTSSDFGVHSSTEYISPWGKSVRTNNYGIGSGTGVHILD